MKIEIAGGTSPKPKVQRKPPARKVASVATSKPTQSNAAKVSRNMAAHRGYLKARAATAEPAKLTGTANALTRGKGNKTGLKKQASPKRKPVQSRAASSAANRWSGAQKKAYAKITMANSRSAATRVARGMATQIFSGRKSDAKSRSVSPFFDIGRFLQNR